jgi:glycosyltransferase involved in cell wall biosynthesis
MSNQDLISILLPVLNGQDSISNAIDSILNQSHKNFELIIINDGSTDNTDKIITNFSLIDKRIKIITNPKNIGIVKSLNLGIDFASGNFIARQDADDYSHPKRLEIMLHIILKYNYDLLSTLANYQLNKDLSEFPIMNFNNYKIKNAIFKRGNPIVHGSILAKANLLKDNYFNPEIRLIEDFELWLRLKRLGYKIGIINLTLYNYKAQIFQAKYFEQYLISLEVRNKNILLILIKSNIFVDIFKVLYEKSTKFYMISLTHNNYLKSKYYKLISIIYFPFKLL